MLQPYRLRQESVMLWLSTVTAFSLCLGSTAFAQLPQTRLYSVFPTGVQKGIPTEVTLANGVDLEEVNSLIFSHPGISAKPKLNMADGKPIANVFIVTADANVPVGNFEVRGLGKYGISNPRTFVVGDRLETLEVEPNNSRETATKIELNSVANGRSNAATDIDWFKVALKQGQRVIMHSACGTIDSRFDGVVELFSPTGRLLIVRRDKTHGALIDFTPPADGDYFVKIYDSVYAGSNDHFYRLAVHTGPHIDYVFPPSGLPNTTADFMVYGRNLPGSQVSPVKIGGQVLEQLKVQIAIPPAPTIIQGGRSLRSNEGSVDGFPYALTSPTGTSTPVMIYFATGTPTPEVEPNDTTTTSQAIPVPCEVVGQFQARGDIDYYTFDAKINQVFWLDVYGERNGGTVDPYLTLERIVKDDKGVETATRIIALDESSPNVRPLVFDTLSNDPAYRFQAPADGKYRVSVRDRYFESRGDPQMVYRLSIRNENPDFRLAAVAIAPKPQDQAQVGDPWELVLRKGDNVQVEVYSFRMDGFNGVIDVTAEGLPPGVTCAGASIGAGQNLTTLVFSSTEDAAPWNGSIKISGTAQITDAAAPAGTAPKTVSRDARAGTIVWNRGPGVPSIARLAQSMVLSVISESAPYQIVSAAPLRVDVNQGTQILLPLKLVKRNGFDDNVALTFVGQPQNVQLENKPINKGKDSELLRMFIQNNAPPGTYTVYLKSQATIAYRRNVEAADAAQKEKEATDKLLAEVTEANKKATETKVAADKKAVDTAAEEKKAIEAKASADKLATDAQLAATKAAEEKAKADKLATDTDAASKLATEAVLKAKEALDKAPDNQDLKNALAAAEKTASDAVTAAKTALDAKAVADKSATETAEAAKKAAEAKVLTDKAAVDAAGLAKTAVEEKTAAEKALAEITQKLKEVTAAKQVADKKATDTANASKANNIIIFPPSSPITITIKPAPVTLAAAAANGGALKRGEKNEVKVTITRTNGFMGPVVLSLPLPPNVTGLTAEPVTIPADKTEGILVVQAAADATEGALANMIVHATMEFNGKAAVDLPLALTVQK